MLKKLWQFHCCHSFQTVDKPLDYIKTGSQGRSPSNIAPFPGKGVWG